jgi:hypothetical protein
MWEHRNLVLYNMQLEALQTMCNAEINDAITKLYKKVETSTAEDHWYFDLSFALRLWKPL